MGRPRKFNADEALDRALHVFWSKGYAATSMTDLLDAMGLSKSSFYEFFGNKHDAFMAALRRYADREVARLDASVCSGGCARRLIEIQLRGVIDRPTGEGDRRGCLTVNCAVELAPHDPVIESAVTAHMDRMEELFHRLIARGQAEGGISSRQDARMLARYLLNGLCGLQVMAKAGRDAKSLEDVVSTILTALD
ncbi:TetR family transcriptional regulator [Skermanella stibiiresistens SB22]|uniref:TetR family transcriptional regulator n=1 Tax=Skermanella stibiiresistens SB22 TaxID=1385369 RepID=W9H8Q5_9PROT|nr:TetR/AcrR family transcriptional regulator [Skermanella stibiiresistens]EWY40173.1 TetR family transcriptional regulator [Skermanella stibiiresistens SB22]